MEKLKVYEPFLSKATVFVAIVFLLLCLSGCGTGQSVYGNAYLKTMIGGSDNSTETVNPDVPR